MYRLIYGLLGSTLLAIPTLVPSAPTAITPQVLRSNQAMFALPVSEAKTAPEPTLANAQPVSPSRTYGSVNSSGGYGSYGGAYSSSLGSSGGYGATYRRYGLYAVPRRLYAVRNYAVPTPVSTSYTQSNGCDCACTCPNCGKQFTCNCNCSNGKCDCQCTCPSCGASVTCNCNCSNPSSTYAGDPNCPCGCGGNCNGNCGCPNCTCNSCQSMDALTQQPVMLATARRKWFPRLLPRLRGIATVVPNTQVGYTYTYNSIGSGAYRNSSCPSCGN